MAGQSAESQKAQEVIDAAMAPLVALLARQIAFATDPKKALRPCRNAVMVALGEHFQNLMPHEHDWMVEFIMERVIAGAAEILTVNRLASR